MVDRSEWLEVRRSGIGGSDAGAICGVSPFKTALDVYLDKTGELEPVDISDNPAVYWGVELEDKVAAEYAKRTGNQVRRVNTVKRSKEHAFMLANIDRDVVGQKRGLECKTTAMLRGWGPAGSDEVPDEYLMQCMHYMSVLSYEAWDLAVFILPTRDFRIYTIPRDDHLIAYMVQIETDFWAAVQRREPPLPDFAHAKTADLLKRMYPGTNGQTVPLPADINHWHAVRLAAKETIKAQEAVVNEAENRIRAAMGECAIGLLPDGSAYVRKETKRAAFAVEATSFMALRHTKTAPKS